MVSKNDAASGIDRVHDRREDADIVFAARHDRRIGFKSIACPAEHWLELAARHLTPVAIITAAGCSRHLRLFGRTQWTKKVVIRRTSANLVPEGYHRPSHEHATRRVPRIGFAYRYRGGQCRHPRGPGRVRAHAPKDRAVGSKIHWCHVSWIASLSIAVLEGGERQPPQDRYIAYRRPNLCVLFGDWPTPVFVVRIGKVSKPDRPSAGYRFRRCRQSLWLPDGEYHGR